MKRLLYLLITFCIVNSSLSQTLNNTNEYIFDISSLNPAATGIQQSALHLYYGQKLAGIKEAPKTQSIRFQKQFAENTGIGFGLYNTLSGPSGSTAFYLSYAHIMKLNKKVRLALGIKGEVRSVFLDEKKLVLDNPNDNAIDGEFHRNILPEASTGLYVYANKWSVGFAVANLYGNEIYSKRAVKDSIIPYSFLLHGDYAITMTKIRFIPQIKAEYQAQKEILINANLLAVFQQQFIVGASINSAKSIAIISGVISEKLHLNYVYTFPPSNMHSQIKGSHELILSFQLK